MPTFHLGAQEFLIVIFRQNGYCDQQIHRALNPPVGLPLNQIGQMLFQPTIKVVGFPPRKIFSFLQPGQDNLGLNMPGMYSIPC
jgi:hypothetical protein